MDLSPEHSEGDKNLEFLPLRELKSISVIFIWESPPLARATMKFIVWNSSFPLRCFSLVIINDLVAMTEFFSKLCDGNALSFVTRRPKFFAGQWSSFSHAVQQDCQPLKRHQFSSENLQRMTKWRLLYFQGQQAQSHCRRRNRCGMGISQKEDSSPWT